MMSTLSKNNSVEKLAEIDLIGFRFLRLVPNWSVKQAMMVHLAESYQVKPRTFILDIGNIRLNAELIRKVFSIPSRGDPFPALDESNSSHVAIKNGFHRRSTTELRDLVYSCPMTTESDRMKFRRYFILVVMKMFLCPTTQQVLSPLHIYPVLDVSDPRRFNWPLEILKWFDTAVEKYKLKGKKRVKAAYSYSIFSICSTVCLTIVLSMSHDSKREPRRVLKRRRSILYLRGAAQKRGEAKKDRPRRCPPKKSEEKDLPSGTDDDEENEPLAKRMC
ncbi:hypothetical protein Ahy_A08g038610 [Arachis hypogaea]|uniref:Aminotransferase-like plant mobile domain-containing protein n=1 Tax=Arachis hypogaea TaxID=3818 RepID=A0A445BTX1_ARAHY|nr:hypothetical protein Ahy_A08g038610 [Arachis hypogaea]